MNVSLTPILENMVNEKVKSGMYHSASEVIREALRLLKEQDALRELRFEELKKEVQAGFERIERGEFASYPSGRELSESIKVESRKPHSERSVD